MSSLDDLAGVGVEIPPVEDINQDEEQAPGMKFQMPQIDLSFLKAKTGEGTIDDYTDHVLNFNKSPGVAQILRGATGIFGELNKGIIDVLLGLIKLSSEKKGKAATSEHGI